MGSWSFIDAQNLSLSKPCSPEAAAIEAGETLANLNFSSSIIFEIELTFSLAPGADTAMAAPSPVMDQPLFATARVRLNRLASLPFTIAPSESRLPRELPSPISS